MAYAPINPTHSTASVTNTTGAVVAANTARRYLLLVNDGVADVYIKIGAAAVANEGIRISGNGGSYEMSEALANLSRAAVNGITASGTSTMLVTEGV